MRVKVAQGRLKQRTLDDYEKLLHRYALKPFGGKAIASITPRDCEDFLADLVGRGIAPKMTKHAWGSLKRVLKYALQHSAISSSPADRVEFGGGHGVGDRVHFEHHPLTGEQVARVAATVGERYPVYELATLFLAYTGVRAAEASGSKSTTSHLLPARTARRAAR